MYEVSQWSGIQKNPRKMKWFSDLQDPPAVYAFSKNSFGGYTIESQSFNYGGLKPHRLTKTLKDIRKKVVNHINSKKNPGEKKVKEEDFNSVLVNYYEDGKNVVDWHADKDPWLGTNFTVPSISFGAERPFCVRSNDDKKEVYPYMLKHGSLLLMKGMTQEAFQHSVPESSVKKARINLTFRAVIPSMIKKNPMGFKSLSEFRNKMQQWFRCTDLTAGQETIINNTKSPHHFYQEIKALNKIRVSVNISELLIAYVLSKMEGKPMSHYKGRKYTLKKANSILELGQKKFNVDLKGLQKFAQSQVKLDKETMKKAKEIAKKINKKSIKSIRKSAKK
jgi:hypothetical protein